MNASLESVQKSIDKTREFAKLMGEAFLLAELAEAGKKAIEYAANLNVTSKQLGLTVQQLQVYRFAASEVNVSQDEMDLGLRRLEGSLGKASVGAVGPTKALAALGISVRDSNGHLKTAGDLFPQIADKLSKISSPLQRAAEEVTLFGRQGQQLDPLLTQGGKGIDDFKKKAEDLGLILSNEMAEKAHEAEVRMKELNAQLRVSFASVVAENANAILTMASALSTLTTKAITFIGNWPRLSAALAGAAMGARAGPLGMLIGGAGGAIAGNYMAGTAADSNMDLHFRQAQLQAAKQNYLHAQQAANDHPIFRIRSGNGAGTVGTAKAELERQTKLVYGAIAFQKQVNAPQPTGAELPDFLAGKGPKPKKEPKEKHDPLEGHEDRFTSELDRINNEILQAKRQSAVEINDQAKIDMQEVVNSTERQKLSIDKEVNQHHLLATEGEQLKTAASILGAEKTREIGIRETQAKADEALGLQIAANDNQKLILDAQGTIARTAKDRNSIALRLLDLDERDERARQEAVLASELSTAAQKKIAQAALDTLSQLHGLRVTSINRQNAGPLAAYLNDMPKGADEIGERVQQLEVTELQSVRDGISNAISKTLGVKDPLITGLIQMFIEQNLIKPIANALQKANGGSGGIGGILGAIGGIFGAVKGGSGVLTLQQSTLDATMASLPKFANGTSGAPGGLAMVGENGPEIVSLRPGAAVIPNHRLRGMAMPTNDNNTRISVEASPYFDVRVNGQISQAAPSIASAGAEGAASMMAYRGSRRLG